MEAYQPSSFCSDVIFAPKLASMRSVWSLDRDGSIKTVGLSA